MGYRPPTAEDLRADLQDMGCPWQLTELLIANVIIGLFTVDEVIRLADNLRLSSIQERKLVQP